MLIPSSISFFWCPTALWRISVSGVAGTGSGWKTKGAGAILYATTAPSSHELHPALGKLVLTAASGSSSEKWREEWKLHAHHRPEEWTNWCLHSLRTLPDPEQAHCNYLLRSVFCLTNTQGKVRNIRELQMWLLSSVQDMTAEKIKHDRCSFIKLFNSWKGGSFLLIMALHVSFVTLYTSLPCLSGANSSFWI